MSYVLYHRPAPEQQRELPFLAAELLAAFPNLIDAVPAYESLYLEYDPAQVSAAEIRAWLAGFWSGRGRVGETAVAEAPLTEIPVCYDGEDLQEAAEYSGLTLAEVVEMHSSETYTVRALGFVAGFPFMETTPSPLQMPRRSTPRAAVPPHSLAVAGAQTGIYPVTAPGGWNLLGRTLVPVYDPMREPPFLLSPGTQVKFRPVEGDAPHLPPLTPRPLWPEQPTRPLLQVRKAGVLGLLMDRGRFQSGRFGLVRSGALDSASAGVANSLLGNSPDAALLEFHLTGPQLDILAPGVLAWAGQGMNAQLNGAELTPYSSFEVRAGDLLTFTPNGAGRVVYLATQGGFETLPFMGSASTDLKGNLGRPLKAGDVFGTQTDWNGFHLPRHFNPYQGSGPLRLLPVGEGDTLDPEDVAALTSAPFRLRDLDRMAGRLTGPSLRGGEIRSEGCPVGTLQVPPSGEVMVLLNDKGTLGGYRKPARIHPLDLPRLVQLLPGVDIQFTVG